MEEETQGPAQAPTEPVKKLIRKTYSCINCRNRKVKCDGLRFCTNCAKRREECEWAEKGAWIDPTKTSPAPGGARIMGGGSPGQASTSRVTLDGPSGRQDRSGASSTVFGAGSPASLISPAAGQQQLSPGDAGVKGHEQFDHSILLRAGAPSNRSPGQLSTVAGGSRTQTPRALASFPFAGSGLAYEQLFKQQVLPAQPYCDALVSRYLERVQWIHAPLHVPTFLADYNAFWATPESRRPAVTEPKWLALLFAVLCLAVHFGDGLPVADANEVEEEERYYAACQCALAESDFLGNHSIEAIQTIICACMYLNNTDKAPTAQSMLAIATRMAIAMGLSRLPPEGSEVTPGIVDREIGRRLWWSLVTQDAYTASNCHCTHLINLSQATTTLFADANDTDLIEGRPLPGSRPGWGEASDSTFHLEKIPFALTTRRFIDAINASPTSDPPYDVILELDRDYRSTFNNLSPFFRPDKPQPLSSSQQWKAWQRTFMGITLSNRIMRLHRAYMSKGYTNEAYRYSTKACLEAAYDCLDLMDKARYAAFPGGRWWVTLVHCWTAGLAIFVDILQDQADEGDPVLAKKQNAVELAIKLMTPAIQTSAVADRACNVLRALLDQDRIRRITEGANQRKRRREEDSAGGDRPAEKRVATTAPANVGDGINYTLDLGAFDPSILPDPSALTRLGDPFGGWNVGQPDILPSADLWSEFLDFDTSALDLSIFGIAQH